MSICSQRSITHLKTDGKSFFQPQNCFFSDKKLRCRNFFHPASLIMVSAKLKVRQIFFKISMWLLYQAIFQTYIFYDPSGNQRNINSSTYSKYPISCFCRILFIFSKYKFFKFQLENLTVLSPIVIITMDYRLVTFGEHCLAT